jgi:Protein of unknown function (DUF1460)
MPPSYSPIRNACLVISLTSLSIILSNARWHDRSLAQDFSVAQRSSLAERLPQIATPLLAGTIAPAEAQVFQQIMQGAIASNLAQRPMSQIMQTVAAQFLGAPYVAGLLDQTQQEQLVVTLQEFDCVLFVETVLALARTVRAIDYTESTFVQHLSGQRYRGGTRDGYCSRLHYFADWILDNQAKGIVTDLTAQLGGIPIDKPIDFMSTHRSSYPQLANESDYQCILAQEARLNQQEIRYIPTEEIYKIYSQLQPGDIVAIATAVPGLDVTHTGLIDQIDPQSGQVSFIHAAPGGVRIASDLQSYVERVEAAIGIMVARPVSQIHSGIE